MRERAVWGRDGTCPVRSPWGLLLLCQQGPCAGRDERAVISRELVELQRGQQAPCAGRNEFGVISRRPVTHVT